MASLAFYILQVNVDLSVHRDAILSGVFQPNADDKRLIGYEKISDLWPRKPCRDFLNIFIRVSTSQ
jgi:hypothetical protein